MGVGTCNRHYAVHIRLGAVLMIYISFITAFLGAAGFALFCGLRPKFVPVAALGGVLCWSVYSLFEYFNSGIFFASFTASVCCALYGEICARLLKAPAVIFFTPSIIILIPGRTLYYTVSYIVENNFSMAAEYGWQTAQCAIAIAAGIGVILSLFSAVERIKKRTLT